MKKLLTLISSALLIIMCAGMTVLAAPQDFSGNESWVITFYSTDNAGNLLKYKVEGDSADPKAVALSDVLNGLSVSGTVSKAESSDATLLSVSQDTTGAYIITPLKLFGYTDNPTVNITFSDSTSPVSISVNCTTINCDLISVEDCTISSIPASTYTGNEIKPTVNVSYRSDRGNITFVEGTDYTLTYDNNVNASNNAKVTINGLGTDTTDPAYSGSRLVGSSAISFTIKPYPVTVTVKGKTKSVAYTGNERSVAGYDIESSDKYLYPVVKYGNTSSSVYYDFTGDATAKGTNPGTYNMSLAVNQFKNNNSNFNVTFNVTDGSLEIEKKKLTGVKMESRTFEYTGDYNPSYRPNGVPADAKTLYGTDPNNVTSQSSRMFKNVGKYDIYYKIDENDPNYTCDPGQAVITITPLTAQLEWPAAYTSESDIKPVVKNLVSGDKCDVTVTVTKGTNSVVCKATALSNSNYRLPTTDLTRTYEITSTASNSASGSASSSGKSGGSSNTGSSGSSSASNKKTSGSSSTTSNASTSASKNTASASATGTSASDSLFDESSFIGDDPLNERGTASSDTLEKDNSNDMPVEEEILYDESFDEAVSDSVEADGYVEDENYDEESYIVDTGVYDSEHDMTYGRAVHLASPDRFRVIYAILIVAILSCVVAGIVFLIIFCRMTQKN